MIRGGRVLEASRSTIGQILLGYPDVVQELWKSALGEVTNQDFEIQAAITFGSLVSGDFCYVRYHDQLYLISDFELALIVESGEIDIQKERIRRFVAKFNETHRADHLGFNLNVKVNTRAEFLERNKTDFFMHGCLTATGNTVFGDDGVLLDALCSPTPPLLSTIFQKVYNQILTYVLIQSNPRVIAHNSLFPIFFTYVCARALSKCTYLYSCRKGRYPLNLADGLDVTRGTIPNELFSYLVQSHKVIRSKSCVVNKLDTRLAEGLLEVAIDLGDSLGLGPDWALRKHRLLVAYLAQVRERKGLDRFSVPEETETTVRDILANKAENYDYYKELYGCK